MHESEIDVLPALVKDFARHKKTIQGCSDKTVSEYLLDLRMFTKYMMLKKSGERVDEESIEAKDIAGADISFFGSVTPSDIYDFLYYLDTVRRDGAKTRARKLSAVKGFYKFLVNKKGILEVNPCGNIESPKLKKTLPKYLSVDESVSLLEAIKNDNESKTVRRDYAMITLFLNCGMRLSELAGINLRDLDHELRSLRVIGKGSKERIVYLNDACKMALGEYLTLRMQTQVPPGENALFISSRGKRISVKTVQYVVYKYLDLAGLGNKGYSTHKLRHTAATLMYQSGEVDIRVLKDILGHEQLNTTQIYTHVSDKGMESAMSKNPLSKIKPPEKKFEKINKDGEEE